MLPFCLRREQNRNDTGAGAKIQHPLPLLHLRKSGEQYSVHSKTEQALILNNPVSVAVQLIDPLTLF